MPTYSFENTTFQGVVPYQWITMPRDRSIKEFHNLIRTGDKHLVARHVTVNSIKPKNYYRSVKSTYRNCLLRAVGEAAHRGHVDVVRYLISEGFDRNEHSCHEGFSECSPIHLACEMGHIAVVKVLVEEYGVDVNREAHFSPLHWTARSRRFGTGAQLLVNVARYLVQAGSHGDTREEDAIFRAAADSKCPEILDFLVAYNPDAYINPEYDYTPLHTAARGGYTGTARALLEAGADVNALSYDRETPFIEGILSGETDMLKLLTSYGADPEIAESFGNTPLHQAIWYHLYNIAHYLIVDLNVTIHKTDSSGRTAFAVLIRNDGPKDDATIALAELLVASGHNPVEALSPCMDTVRDVPDILWTDMINRFKVIATNPRTLKDVCVKNIRRRLGAKTSGVESFAVPQIVQDAISLRDKNWYALCNACTEV
ncbi:death-associated protein kinase dapk-1-like isoform X2 [Haliotis asinina]|uniref:death-associated protein kinase dapk-1-like isoform X2 n=1 Tax=Haliotis asinina TaxID=109174 RepID=UPI00353236FC